MSSKIGGVASTVRPPPIGAGRAVAASAGRGRRRYPKLGRVAGGDQENVQITGAARQLATLEQAVRDAPEVNSARVAQISSSIEQGTYTVNAQDIADKLVQMEKELAHLGESTSARSGI